MSKNQTRNGISPAAGVALYLRISKADLAADPYENESSSIENQRTLLTEYAKRNFFGGEDGGLREAMPSSFLEYVDDGYSGSNFDRPSFKQMVEDCKKGTVKTILVKDLSRLGRDYIAVGDYIEQIFPMLGVRFISVGDRFDSLNIGYGTPAFGLALKSIVNTLYCRDCSRKRISAAKAKWKQGIYTASRVPFGYRLGEDGKWYPDKDAAETVQTIFSLALQGYGTAKIADKLNRLNVPTPYRYAKIAGAGYKGRLTCPEEKHLWSTNMVWRIIRDESYTGTMVQGKSRIAVPGTSKRVSTGSGERYCRANAHRALVSEKEFEQAQQVIRPRKQSAFPRESDRALKGKIRCKNCGRLMQYRENSWERFVFCAHRIREGSLSACPGQSFSYDMIEKSVMQAIRNIASLAGNLIQKLNEKYSGKYDVSNTLYLIESLQSELARIYENYTDGYLSIEEFLGKKERISKDLAAAKEQVWTADAGRAEIRSMADALKSIRAAAKTCARRLRGDAVCALVENVYVHGNGELEIIFKAKDVIEKAAAACGIGRGDFCR